MKTCQGIPGQRAPTRDTNHAPPLAERSVEPATSGQLSYLRRPGATERETEGLDKRGASRLIDEMKEDENEGSSGCAMLVLAVVVVAAVTVTAAALS